MQPIDLQKKKIATLKEARDRCFETFNRVRIPYIRECLQLTCEALIATIAIEELALQNLLTSRDAQRDSDRPHIERQPI